MLKYIVFLLSISVIACTAITGDHISKLRPGMNKADVVATLGNPDGYRRTGDMESLMYSNRLTSGWGHDRADYAVLLKNGQVVEYGAGDVRVKQMDNLLVFVPVNPSR